MKPIAIELSEDLAGIDIMPIADWHWSDPNSNHDRILEDVAFIHDHPNVYTVLHGDILDCAIASSIGDTYSSLVTPMEELRICTEIFEPIKDRILCLTEGNHEMRHYKTNGIRMTEVMARQLGLYERYSPTTALLFVRLGRYGGKRHFQKVQYTVFVSHGSGGGGRKEGGKIQRLADLSSIVDCDCYIVGHTHLPAIFKDSCVRPDTRNNSLAYCPRLYVNVSAKLNYGGYGEFGGYKVPCLDTPVIHLSGEKKEARATV